MTLDEAIIILHDLRIKIRTDGDDGILDAIKLGMEALYRISLIRRYSWSSAFPQLLGETAVRTWKNK